MESVAGVSVAAASAAPAAAAAGGGDSGAAAASADKGAAKEEPKGKATRTLALVCSIKQFVVNVIVETVLNLTSLETF
jgi:hypothetical protein